MTMPIEAAPGEVRVFVACTSCHQPLPRHLVGGAGPPDSRATQALA